jgi:uncharacterized protein with PIN domain
MTRGEGQEGHLEFIADCMLGRLARWLRILGFDTLYYPAIDDAVLADIAEKENRTILTRDTRLTERKNVKRFLLIGHDDIQMQLKQVVSAYQLPIAPSIESMRCPACNGHLTTAEKSSVKGRVPLYIYRSRDRFKKCAGCGKIYWKGSHYEKIRAKIHLFP